MTVGALIRDPDETAETLGRWLVDRAGFASVDISNVTIPATTGWSNETILFDADWRSDDASRRHELVARIAPGGYRVFVDETFLRQFAVMNALVEHTHVPVPATYWLEEDPAWFGRPFWVMERVAGEIPADTPPYAGGGWLKDAAPSNQARVWWSGIEAMTSIHSVDHRVLGLAKGTFSESEGSMEWHLDHYERYLRWAEDGTPHPVARQALARLRRDPPPAPEQGATITWGDARLSNLIYRDFQVAAVLDWEMTALGDPLLDLGWWLFADEALTVGSGCTRLPGFPSPEETAGRWSGLTGRSTDALEYFLLFSGLRFTVIMLRIGKLLFDRGAVPADFGYDNLISRALEQMMAAG
ncbi:MAG: phosphotransferase family protein [Acidimicrobiales bacterium]|jgi:aminoglycoside phosphotransferase (APT) family kinase protein